jgi:hypothetical protein
MATSVFTATACTAGRGAGAGESVAFRALIFKPVVLPLLGLHGL